MKSESFRFWMLWAILLTYLAVPARAATLLTGTPFSMLGFAASALLIAAAFAARPARAPRLSVVLLALLLVVLRLTTARVMVPTGWAGTYYRNAEFSGNAERSTEFRDPRWTRIDRVIDFSANSFPLHFFNDLAFNFTTDRRAPPFSAIYRGYLRSDQAQTIRIQVTASNRFTVHVNSRPVADEARGDPWAGSVAVAGGVNLIEVRYQNPPYTARRLAVAVTGSDGRDLGAAMTPSYPSVRAESVSRAAAVVLTMVDLAALLLIGWLVFQALASMIRGGAHAGRSVLAFGAAVFAIALFHAWSPDLNRHFLFIASGNDGLAYEAYAREALLDGWLLNAGPLHARPLLYTVGYHYWMSVTHVLFGESLVAVYFGHRLLFWLTVLLSAVTAKRLFGMAAALCTVAAGLYFSQYVFWVTSYVFRENLVIALNAALVCAVLARRSSSGFKAAALGLLTGVNVIADPINAAVVPVVGWFVWRDPLSPENGRRRRLTLFLAAAALVVAIVPFRNLIATGVPTPLPTEGAPTLWWGNKPPEGVRQHVVDGDFYAVVWNYAVTEPRHFAGTLARKAIYALGFYHVDWLGNPQLMQFSLVNLLGLILSLCVAATILRRDSRALVLYAMAAIRYASEVVFLANHNVDRYEVTLLMLLLPVIGCAFVWLWRMSPTIVAVLVVGLASRNYMLVSPELGNMTFSPEPLVVSSSYHTLRASLRDQLQGQRLSWSWPQALPEWSRGDSMVAIPSRTSGIYQLLNQNGGGGVQSPDLNVPAPLVRNVRIRAGFTGWQHVAMFFAYRKDGPPAILYFAIDPTGRIRDYVVPVDRSELWAGTITSIAVYYGGDEIELESVSLQPFEPAVPPSQP